MDRILDVCVRGDLDELVEQYITPNQPMIWVMEILFMCITYGHLECVQYIIDQGILSDINKERASMMAALRGRVYEFFEGVVHTNMPLHTYWFTHTNMDEVRPYTGMRCIRYFVEVVNINPNQALRATVCVNDTQCRAYLIAQGARVDDSTISMALENEDDACLLFLVGNIEPNTLCVNSSQYAMEYCTHTQVCILAEARLTNGAFTQDTVLEYSGNFAIYLDDAWCLVPKCREPSDGKRAVCSRHAVVFADILVSSGGMCRDTANLVTMMV